MGVHGYARQTGGLMPEDIIFVILAFYPFFNWDKVLFVGNHGVSNDIEFIGMQRIKTDNDCGWRTIASNTTVSPKNCSKCSFSIKVHSFRNFLIGFIPSDFFVDEQY